MVAGGVDVPYGSEVEVGCLHDDLRAAIGDDNDGFESVETAVGGADVAGDGAGGGDVGFFEIDVVGDEEAAGSDGAGPGSLVEFGAADVGAAGGVAASGVAKAFELTAAHVFKLDAVGPGGGGAIEV